MISTEEMLKVFARHRGDAIVVPGRGGRYWVKISDKPSRDRRPVATGSVNAGQHVKPGARLMAG